MSTNRFWHRGISMACLGVFSLFLMTAATGCNNCCMRKGDGDNQAQAKTTQSQAGFAKSGHRLIRSSAFAYILNKMYRISKLFEGDERILVAFAE